MNLFIPAGKHLSIDSISVTDPCFVILWVVDSQFPQFWPYALTITLAYLITDWVYVKMIKFADRREREFGESQLPYLGRGVVKLATGTTRFLAVLVALLVSAAIATIAISWIGSFDLQAWNWFDSFLPSLVIVIMVYFYFVYRYRIR